MPGAAATLEAMAVGLLIPTFSAIIPIQRALAKSLSDSLNTARASLSGTVVTIQDKNLKVIPFIVFGLLCVTFGVTIYIILPQALLAENLGLILQVFFFILAGLILGLTLLAANLRGFIEIITTYILFFWERKSMRTLIKKNLVAHKRTNKLTSIIYALTLGCVIFLCVSLNLLIKATQTKGVYQNADIVLSGVMQASRYLDLLLQKNSDVIKDFGYVTQPLNFVAFFYVWPPGNLVEYSISDRAM